MPVRYNGSWTAISREIISISYRNMLSNDTTFRTDVVENIMPKYKAYSEIKYKYQPLSYLKLMKMTWL